MRTQEGRLPVTTPELASYILQQCRQRIHAVNAPGLIAITGASCSGKSSLSRQIGWHARTLGFEVTLHHLDDYQVAPEGWSGDEASGTSYYEAAFDIPAFLDAVHRDAASRRDSTAGFVVADGEFLLKAQFRTLWDFSVWVETDEALIIERARTRHLEGANGPELEAMRSPDGVERVYRTLCIPALRHHVATDSPQSHANRVVASLENGWALAGDLTKPDGVSN